MALAFLLRQDESWRRHPLRVNMIVRGSPHAEADELIAGFLRDARVEAETRVIESEGEPFVETIAANSADAAVTFVGLRSVEQDEPESAFGDYVRVLADGLSSVACPVFVLAGEDVDFHRIFT